MQKITDPSSITGGRALIIGKTVHKVHLLKRHLAEYFSKIDLLTDLGQLKSLTADSHSIIVVTDTLGDVLNYAFIVNLRSLHPRARLLCLVDQISRETEKSMRSAGLLFLGSYDHFGVCYRSILETALSKLNPTTHQFSNGSK